MRPSNDCPILPPFSFFPRHSPEKDNFSTQIIQVPFCQCRIYNDIPRALFHLCGLPLSPGAVVGFNHKSRKQGEPLYEGLKQSLPQRPFLHADETGWKDDWLWIFTNPDIAFYHIDKSRGSKVQKYDGWFEMINSFSIDFFINNYSATKPDIHSAKFTIPEAF